MNIEIFIVLGLILFIVVYNNKTTLQKFIISSDSSVNYLREKDYTMFSEEKINELTQVRRKIGAGSVLGKIFKIFD